MRPQPAQQPHPSIWSEVEGRRWSAALVTATVGSPIYIAQRCKGLADSPRASGKARPQGFRDHARDVRPRLSGEGLRKSGLKKAAQSHGGTYGQDFSEIAKKYAMFGTPQQCAKRLDQYLEARVRHFVLAGSGAAPDGLPGIEVIAKDVILLVRKG